MHVQGSEEGDIPATALEDSSATDVESRNNTHRNLPVVCYRRILTSERSAGGLLLTAILEVSLWMRCGTGKT